MDTSQKDRAGTRARQRAWRRRQIAVGVTALALATTPIVAQAAVPNWIVKFSASGAVSWIMKQYYESRGYTCYKVLPWWFCARSAS